MFKEKHFTYIWNSAREMVPHPCLALTWSSSVSCPEEVHVAGLMRDKGLVYFSLNYLAFILKISKDWLCSLCNHMTFAIEVHLKTEMRKSMKGAKCISVVSISEFHIRYTYLGVNPSLLQKRWEIINTSGRKKGHGNLWHEMRENPIGSRLAESRNFRWNKVYVDTMRKINWNSLPSSTEWKYTDHENWGQRNLHLKSRCETSAGLDWWNCTLFPGLCFHWKLPAEANSDRDHP